MLSIKKITPMKKIIHFISYFGLFISLLVAGTQIAIAEESDPVAMLRNTTDELIDVLKANSTALKTNHKKVYSIVDNYLAPKVDFVEMARWVVGRTAWKRANNPERRAFVSAFRELVIKTYAGALSNYDSQKVKYLPLRGGVKGKKRVQVASRIIEPGKQPISVAYRLVNRSGQWKVYDIIIEGVSLIKGFQSQFSSDVSERGLATVTAKIRSHNKKAVQ